MIISQADRRFGAEGCEAGSFSDSISQVVAMNRVVSPSRLRLVRVAIDTYRENVAFIHRDCPVYRVEGFQALTKISVSNDGETILAVLNVVDDPEIVQPDQLGLSEQAFDQFGRRPGTSVVVAHAEPPRSMAAVRRKIGGERLLQGGLFFDVTAHRAGFVSGIDNYLLARIARLAGAPMDPGAGVDLYKKLGDEVAEGEPLFRVYAQFKSDFAFARQLCAEHGSGYTLVDTRPEIRPFVEDR